MSTRQKRNESENVLVLVHLQVVRLCQISCPLIFALTIRFRSSKRCKCLVYEHACILSFPKIKVSRWRRYLNLDFTVGHGKERAAFYMADIVELRVRQVRNLLAPVHSLEESAIDFI